MPNPPKWYQITTAGLGLGPQWSYVQLTDRAANCPSVRGKLVEADLNDPAVKTIIDQLNALNNTCCGG